VRRTEAAGDDPCGHRLLPDQLLHDA
jgi:hypothetical protein